MKSSVLLKFSFWYVGYYIVNFRIQHRNSLTNSVFLASSARDDLSRKWSEYFTGPHGRFADTFNKKKATLKELRLGEFNILITPGKYLSVVIISSAENLVLLEKPVHRMIDELEKKNDSVLKNWDGNQNSIKGINKGINKMVNGGYWVHTLFHNLHGLYQKPFRHVSHCFP